MNTYCSYYSFFTDFFIFFYLKVFYFIFIEKAWPNACQHCKAYTGFEHLDQLLIGVLYLVLFMCLRKSFGDGSLSLLPLLILRGFGSLFCMVKDTSPFARQC